MSNGLELNAPLAALDLHPQIAALLVAAGCRIIRDVMELEMEKLQDCGISLKELREIVEQVEEPAGMTS